MKIYPLKETLFSIGSINVKSSESNKNINNSIVGLDIYKQSINEIPKAKKSLFEDFFNIQPQLQLQSKNYSSHYEMAELSSNYRMKQLENNNNFSKRDATIGLAVGGSKNIQNFRKNLKRNYLPLFTDMTYEGLYYDYYFETGDAGDCDALFCPSYVSTISKDPLNNKDEYFISVGLNSGLKKSDFKRKKLNLVVLGKYCQDKNGENQHLS